VTTHVTKS